MCVCVSVIQKVILCSGRGISSPVFVLMCCTVKEKHNKNCDASLRI